MQCPAEACEKPAMAGRVMDPDNVNPNVKKTVYAVRGELYIRASELQKEGKKIIFTNFGNPHALGQKPLTFPRQVMALCQAPFLMDDPRVEILFPADAIARAKQYLAMTSGGVGAYTETTGIFGIRQQVAEFILERDGYPSDPETIFLTDGATRGVQLVLQALICNEKDGVLVPIPQYPLYSATIQLLGGTLVPYHLTEEERWATDVKVLQKAVNDARRKGITVRGLVFINPGNPTGQCLAEAIVRDVINFCIKERLVLLADEVYQQNVYQDERPFVSAKKVLMDMGHPACTSVELVSFHSVSKGFLGECGQRGGYFELTNFHPQTVDELYKVASICGNTNVSGQLMIGLMVKPPRPGDFSYPQYAAERQAILESLRRRAHIMTDGFNACENVVCNFTEGAMYSFPRVNLPEAAIIAAKKAGKAPDVFYCLKLLEATGMSTVPGSGFGQQEGTFHVRTTILAGEKDMLAMMESFKEFNANFMIEYQDSNSMASLL